MRPQKAVIRETVHILAGTAAMALITVAVCATLGKADAACLLGALYGSALAVLNFFALGMTVQLSAQGIQEGDDAAKRRAKAQMQFSYSVRMLAVFLLEVLALSVLKLNAVTCLLPLLFPRITIMIMNLTKRKGSVM